LPDRSKTLGQGVVKPWQTTVGAESQRDLMRMCRQLEIPTDVPFEKLPKKWRDFVIDGEPDYGKDEEHQWPRAWYGVKGYFRWLESRAYKMHVRVLLSRYRAYTPCPDCGGKRFQPEALLYLCERPQTGAQAEKLTLADFYQMPVRDAFHFIESLGSKALFAGNQPLNLVLSEVRARLSYLSEVGLGYLTLDRPTRSLSGGETERVNLTTCLGTRLVNTLFVLDEPSVGLHPRDTARLVTILQRLRDAGNTVLVVEHEPAIMRAANQIVDLGPGHGATGGQLVFQGSYRELLKSGQSITGRYLRNRNRIEIPIRRPVTFPYSDSSVTQRRLAVPASAVLHDAPAASRHLDPVPALKLVHASRHNLKDLTVELPLRRFVCVAGVSGSGKTTLVREVLVPALAARLKSGPEIVKASDRMNSEENGSDDASSATGPLAQLLGTEHLGHFVLVDQSLLGKTPRSNPAVYIGAFDAIREFFAESEPANQRGLEPSSFSFNSSQGQCERCRGAGFEKIEMQFLSDIFIKCPDCNGRRYRSHILEVKVSPSRENQTAANSQKALSIADLLDSTVEEAIGFLAAFPESRSAQRARQSLSLLEEVGLGYLRLGQPINTLSGGESQRLKLVRELAAAGSEATEARPQPSTNYNTTGARRLQPAASSQEASARSRTTLFLFDEPTTGLHFDDVRILLKVFQRLVDAGHSVLVIEHNLDVIKSADWVIDLGPDAGDEGGRVVALGTPEQIAACTESHTGSALREVLPQPARQAATFAE
jgi:excinuclease ABC subunit A